MADPRLAEVDIEMDATSCRGEVGHDFHVAMVESRAVLYCRKCGVVKPLLSTE